MVANRLWSKSGSKFQMQFSKPAAGAEPNLSVAYGFYISATSGNHLKLLLFCSINNTVCQEDENQGFREKYQ